MSRSVSAMPLRAGLVLASLVLASGCVRVKPHQRARLAQPDMVLDDDADLAAGSAHATEYREGAAGGFGAGGGGCGCN